MNQPVNRHALEEAIRQGWRYKGDRDSLLERAGEAILDGEPLEWCVVHGSESYGPGRNCRKYSDDEVECQIETQVRIRVEP